MYELDRHEWIYKGIYIGYNGTPNTAAKPRNGFRRRRGVVDEVDRTIEKAIQAAERRNSCYGKM